MPELPEVETTRRGIAPHLIGHRVRTVQVHDRRLRWPVPAAISKQVPGQTIRALRRRGKYLLFELDHGHVIVHLGMSGSLRIATGDEPRRPYEHVVFVLDNGERLALRDPRRFGCVLWTDADPEQHRLLVGIGPEPLSRACSGDYLYRLSRGRKPAVKSFIMDARVIAGVGNIYASEALFRAGIHPARAAGRISRQRYQGLARAIKATLRDAIAAGGTTLRDFRGGDGRPGYFRAALKVYGRAECPCGRCGAPIRQRQIGQRSSFYCARCQH